MLVAIIAAVVAALVAAAIIVVVLSVRNRTKTPYANSGKKEVQQLSTVGVGSSGGFARGKGASSRPESDVQVKSGHANSKKPADSLKGRFTGVSIFSVAVFGTLAAKLWSMQILSNEDYSNKAASNLYTTVSTPAPRGYIYDADGIALVKNRSSQTVLADADVVDDHDVVARLSAVLGIPQAIVRQRIQSTTAGAQSQRVVASDVRLRDVAFIAEHSDAFSGVTVETRTVRDYPFGALCAHALGYTGTPSEDQVSKAPSNRDIQLTDDVGKSGIESAYDNLLAGDHGQRVVTVDAQGNVVDVVSETKATRGSDVYLTIKGSVQYAADEALASLIAPSDGVIGTGKGVGGAVVAMNVRDGSIIALSSYPTFDPTNWVGGLSTEANNVYNSDSAHAPLQNRVTAGLYAAASTFKPFTGLAGLEYGFAEGRSWDCTGKWDGFNTGSPQWCWYHNGHGYLDFRGGIVNSCDVVFYEIAKSFFYASKSQGGNLSDTAIQEMVQRFDFGKKAGIDIGGEVEGLVPTPEWKATRWRNVPANATWTGGDYTNMIIGQGDVQVTPIQVAVAYGGIATGKIMKPHLLKEVRNASGQTVVSYESEVVTEPDVDQRYLEIVRDALRGVVTENEGIASLFAESGIKAAGKTGTAEHTDKGDDAWFVCYAPYDDPKYVVATVIEQGGGGSAVAAPVGAKVMEAVMAADAGSNDASSMGRIAGSSGRQIEGFSTKSASRSD